MQIHELNNFTGTLGSGAYLAIDDGTDTGKISSQGLLAATEARIDNIIAGPAPSAEEIVDARLGADGVTYPSLGDAIRDQFTDVKSEFNNALGSFFFDDSVLTDSGYIELNGSEAAHGSFHRSGFIPSLGATEITIVAPITANAGCVVAFYSGNTVSTFISGKSCSAGSSDLTYAVPNNTKYVRFSYKTSGKFKAYFNIKSSIDALPSAVANLAKAFIQGDINFVRASNYQSMGLSDLLSFGNNKSYGIFSDITSAMISGLPVYGKYGTLLKFSPLGTNAFAYYLYCSFGDHETVDMYFCCGSSASVITPWKKLTSGFDGKTFSLLGDSYGTFSQWVPSGNELYYPMASDTVNNVGQTWWYQLSKKMKMKLLVNDSYSGATVCTHVRPAHSPSVAFVNRMKVSMGEAKTTEPKPDVIFVFGGQNDMQVSAEIGDVMYSGWTDADLYKFAPAFCYMLDYLITWNPSATIINITNTGLTEGIASAMATACEHYGIKNVVLTSIDKANMHPTATGMASICNQVMAAML